MGLSYFRWFCFAVFSFATIGYASANYIYDHSRGQWLPTSTTVAFPPTTSVSNRPIPPNPTVFGGGGFSTKGGLNANFPTVRPTVPVTVNGRVSPPAVKSAVKGVLGGGGLAGIVLGAGLQQLLDGIGGLIDEAGNVVRLDPDPDYGNPLTGHFSASDNYLGGPTSPFPSAKAACGVTQGCVLSNACMPKAVDSTQIYCYTPDNSPRGTVSRTDPLSCPSGSFYTPLGCVIDGQFSPIPQPEIDSAVDSSYSPSDDDYPVLAPSPFMAPTETLVDQLPSITVPPVTTTITDLDTGETKVIETNIWHDFSIKNNPSSQPEIDMETTEKKDEFTNGNQTGSSTTTTPRPADPNSPPSVSGGGSTVTVEIPTDCDFMPTVCAFLDWFKDPDLGDEPDLSQIMHDGDFEERRVISFGSKSCPSPMPIQLDVFSRTFMLSFEPACTLASYAYWLVMAASYIIAIYISLGVSRNG